MSTNDTALLVAGIIDEFESINAAREKPISQSRHVIRASADAIRAAHRGEFDDARSGAGEASGILQEIVDHVTDRPSPAGAGYVQDAMKEVAEAHISIAILSGSDLPAAGDLGVSSSAWLNGLAEAASELRRDALDALRYSDVPRAESLLQQMDTIYSSLVTVVFPDAITGGIRRTTDQLRAVLERTRGDITFDLRQDRLERMLRQTESRLRR
ncbi:MAG TPA: haloacid dehalogenase [Thermomicrobiales bacterium]|nr:haloacid dehalogenase [Thermomicrobiales bacterium]